MSNYDVVVVYVIKENGNPFELELHFANQSLHDIYWNRVLENNGILFQEDGDNYYHIRGTYNACYPFSYIMKTLFSGMRVGLCYKIAGDIVDYEFEDREL